MLLALLSWSNSLTNLLTLDCVSIYHKTDSNQVLPVEAEGKLGVTWAALSLNSPSQYS